MFTSASSSVRKPARATVQANALRSDFRAILMIDTRIIAQTPARMPMKACWTAARLNTLKRK